jgi:hypothetical protein
MGQVEREYLYRPRWTTILFLSIGGAVLIVVAANGTYRGLAILLVVLAGIAADCRLACYRRVALTATSVLVPRSLWSLQEQEIEYRAIQSVALSEAGRPRSLQISHNAGKHALYAELLARY